MGDIGACALKFHADFPHFAQINVNGDETLPLFKFLKAKMKVEKLSWNFDMFLCDREGVPVAYRPYKDGGPESFEEEIKTLLAKQPASAEKKS